MRCVHGGLPLQGRSANLNRPYLHWIRTMAGKTVTRTSPQHG